ncbi:hypothetical protein Q5752_006386 [Cryptotrichosporon argae]
MVGLQPEVGQIRAVAWSALPTHRHLLALGLATGRTQLLALSTSSLSVSLSASTQPVILPVKHSRPVTSLSFCSIDGNVLATGLDRHRSDYSLLIWDIADCVSRFPADAASEWTRPERLEATTASLMGRDGDPKYIQHYCPSETVNCVAFVPESFGLLASANNKSLRLYDLRTASREAQAPLAFATRAVYGLAPDAQHPHRFASFETAQSGAVVRLWDIRKGETASFDVAGGVSGLEWVSGTSAMAVGNREGVSVWDVHTGVKDSEEWTSVGGMRQVVRPKQQLHSFALSPSDAPYGDVMFVHRDGSIGVGPIGSAAVIANSVRGEFAVSTTNIILLSPDRALFPTAPGTPSSGQPSPSRSPSPLPSEKRNNRFQLPPARISAILAEASASRSRSASPTSLPASSVLRGLRAEKEVADKSEENGGEGARRILGVDVGYTMRRRAEDGYGLTDLELNAAIATRHPGAERLAGIWEFVHHLLQVMAPHQSRHGTYDLTYQGIWPIWSGQLTPPAPSPAYSALRSHPITRPASASASVDPGRRAGRPLEPHSRDREALRRDKEPDADPAYAAAVHAINMARTENGAPGGVGANRLPHTEKAAQRRMILALCGEEHMHAAMVEVNRLIEDEQRTKAACWAFFASQEEPAVSILLSSPDERHQLMGATVAGFMTQARAQRGSEFWAEHWSKMVDKVEDPYIRAMLRRIAGEDWDAVLYDESLPLLDRIAIATCNLSDRELTAFLRNRVSRVTQLGSLPGLALTGFTSAGLAVVQRWLDRTADLQTAAVLSAYFPRPALSPAEHETVERWRDAYRELMDGWKEWVGRCAFDAAWNGVRRALGEDKVGTGTVVVCPVCNNLLTRQAEEHLIRKNAIRGSLPQPSARTNACLYCQNALPRCCICLQHVRPESRGEWGDAADSIDAAYVSCNTCRHGGHAAHILAWFEGGLDGEPARDVCAVAGCKCRCASL